MRTVRRVVEGQSSLLITGETGVGKERLARAIHADSKRSSGPFIAVNCGALPETLLESELFGHEEGAFTGASRARRGWFELANEGTIFLDEIGEMPLHLQVKLLHVLQSRQVQRLGSEKVITVDVRVIAATNRDLEMEVAEKRFRQDLYYRLSVINLSIPPLRDRKEDIPTLIDDYITRFRASIGRDISGVTSAALTSLTNYHWPGNVRELINMIERAVLLCDAREVDLIDLPQNIAQQSAGSSEQLPGKLDDDLLQGLTSVLEQLDHLPLRAARQKLTADFELLYLKSLLKQNNGRIGETAKQAGIDPRSLFDKLQRHGLRKEDFRKDDPPAN